MTRRCPNCDQLLMEDEAVCWNCGQAMGAAPAEGKPEREETPAGERPLSAVVIYASLTAAVVAGALLLTAFLGGRPRLQAAGAQPPEEWEQVADENETFTLYLPPAWHVVDGGDDEGRATLNRLLSGNALFRDALHPWYQVRDVEAIFLAASTDPEAGSSPEELFLVARSAALNRLTFLELISVVEQSDVIISAAEIVDDYDRRYAYVRLRTPQGLVCQQQFLLGDEEVLLATFCGREEEPSTATLEAVRGTFQRLAD